jgi:hypothetical protein
MGEKAGHGASSQQRWQTHKDRSASSSALSPQTLQRRQGTGR